MNVLSIRVAVPALLSLVGPVSAWACAACGCTLSSDAAMGYSATAGWRVNLEYSYINQDDLRSGTQSISRVADDQELEHQTLNRYYTFGVTYNPNTSWGFSVLAPYIVRTHTTYGEYDSSEPLPELIGSRSSSIGDVKLIGNYQGFLPTHNLGVQLGLKLPTGKYGSDILFTSGPEAGEPLDTSLQPGTGSIDVIVGAYWYQAISQNFDFTASGQFQSAVKQRLDDPGDDFRPGNSISVNLGLRYEANPRWVPQLQLNLLRKQADTGARADTENAAGTVAYLSPGITAQAVKSLYAYGFVQLPVYSNLDGNQLFPHYTATVGVSYAF